MTISGACQGVFVGLFCSFLLGWFSANTTVLRLILPPLSAGRFTQVRLQRTDHVPIAQDP